MIELPRRVKDITGQKFNRLTVVSYKGLNKHGVAIWKCDCSCGAMRIALGSDLRSGHSKSCGCLRSEKVKQMVTKHGKYKTPIYVTWDKMVGRCHRKSDNSFKNYGARGISVCNRWRNSFANFYFDMGDRPEGKSIDRIDNNGNYTPENCRWSSRKTQARNTRKNILIEYDGQSRCISEWAEIIGMNSETLRQRIFRYGWSIDRAFGEEVHSNNHPI